MNNDDTTAVAPPTVQPKFAEADVQQPVLVEIVQATDIRNPWVCQTEGCGAILGSVYHEKVRQGLSISRLILFRVAVKVGEPVLTNYIFGKVDAGEFTCSRCGGNRKWHPTPEVMRYLMEVKPHKKYRSH